MTRPSPDLPRILGEWSTGRPGPTVVLICGLHGNEPAGIEAAREVLAALRSRPVPLRGELVALAGNRQALATGRRFLWRDANRQWQPEPLRALLRRPADQDRAEDREQRELWIALSRLARRSRRPLVVLDLHSTSAAGGVFCCGADTLRTRRLARALPIPLILGLEEAIGGTLVGLLTEQGHVALAVEGGTHRSPDTVAHLTAAVWLALRRVGCLPAGSPVTEHRQRLARASRGYPPLVEIRHRHPVRPGDGFRMRAGFESFQTIAQGSVVADDRHGPIRVPESGRMLMPLYQGLGEDGYFLAREVPPLWRTASVLLRQLQADRLLPLLPGVTQPAREPDRLELDSERAAGWLPDLLALMGYRQRRQKGPRLEIARRRSDWRGLARSPFSPEV